MRRADFVLIFAAIALVAACGGSNSSDDATGGTPSTGGSGAKGGTGGSSASGGGGSGGTSGSGATGASGGTGGSGGSGATGATTGGGGSGGSTSGCQYTGSTDLGVTISFTAKLGCSYTLAEVAAGITIPYEVAVAADVADVTPEPQATCSSVGASGLYVFEEITGNGNAYCLCDNGKCPPATPTPMTLKAGTYPGAFSWDGKNWSGPSDYGAPKGPPFPAGDYTLEVSANVTYQGQPVHLFGELKVTLTP